MQEGKSQKPVLMQIIGRLVSGKGNRLAGGFQHVPQANNVTVSHIERLPFA